MRHRHCTRPGGNSQDHMRLARKMAFYLQEMENGPTAYSSLTRGKKPGTIPLGTGCVRIRSSHSSKLPLVRVGDVCNLRDDFGVCQSWNRVNLGIRSILELGQSWNRVNFGTVSILELDQSWNCVNRDGACRRVGSFEAKLGCPCPGRSTRTDRISLLTLEWH